MRAIRLRSAAFAAALAVVGVAATACGGGSSTNPTPYPTNTYPPLVTPAFASASCSTSGTTSASIPPTSVVGIGTVTSPTVGGCSYASNFAAEITNATAGTYSETISLNAPAGLTAIPASNTCSSTCDNNGPPPGFVTAKFVPVFYVVFQLTGFVGTLSQDDPSIIMTVNSLVLGTNSENLFIGVWGAGANGSAPPSVASTAFSGWSNNDNKNVFATVPLSVPLPNTLTFPAEACTPASACPPATFSTPESLTIVTVVGYFT